MPDRLTLVEALKADRLDEFVAQAEAEGIGPTNVADFDEAVRRLATQPQSEGRTSRSASRGGSSGK